MRASRAGTPRTPSINPIVSPSLSTDFKYSPASCPPTTLSVAATAVFFVKSARSLSASTITKPAVGGSVEGRDHVVAHWRDHHCVEPLDDGVLDLGDLAVDVGRRGTREELDLDPLVGVDVGLGGVLHGGEELDLELGDEGDLDGSHLIGRRGLGRRGVGGRCRRGGGSVAGASVAGGCVAGASVAGASVAADASLSSSSSPHAAAVSVSTPAAHASRVRDLIVLLHWFGWLCRQFRFVPRRRRSTPRAVRRCRVWGRVRRRHGRGGARPPDRRRQVRDPCCGR